MRTMLLPTDGDSLRVAARIIKEGGIVALPTDTVYGLACDPFSESAVRRLFEVKGRERKPIPVLCTSEEVAKRLVALDGRGLELATRHWPGALTIVARLKSQGVPELLHAGTGWLGVRVPRDDIALAVAGAVGGSITGTSANLSGRPSCRDATEVSTQLGERVDAILDGGFRSGLESTVVRIEGESVEVLRRGAVGIDA